MANLQIKNIDERLYHQIKLLAAGENRSVSQQVLFLIRNHLARKGRLQAEETAGQVLLDLGSGCGWPGIHLAVRSGCHLVSVDPVEAGVHRTEARAAAEGLAARSLAMVGDGEHLPLAPGTVDALVHADVLC